jgi:GNAT superfamily N-acetyltransferase
MNLQPLEPQQLLPVQRMAAVLFPWESEHQQALAAVVYPNTREAFLRSHALADVRCWTSHAGSEVAGFATLYQYAAQPDEMWLAWFGFREEFRGRGAGAQLLDEVIAIAKREKHHTLRLWTTDEEEYAAAIRLYLRRGFVSENCSALPGETWRTHVFSLGLSHEGARPWASLPNQPMLCGRDSALVAA